MAQHWFTWLDTWLLRLSRIAILGISLVIAIAIGILDYFIAPDLLVLYLGPLFLSGWYGGRGPAFVVAVYSAAASFVTLTFVSGSHEFNATAMGNLVVRVAAYLAIAHLFARLRESRRQQDDLVGFIIHDLRSPVASAITGLQTLEQTEYPLHEEDREMIQLALVSNQRALTLINSILDVAKLESGKMAVKWEQHALEPFLEETLAPLALWANGLGIHLEKLILKDEATFDRELTARVLANLVSNALKFSPEGTTVTVITEPEHAGIKFLVTDQGPGIPADQADAIFEPFSQVEGTQGGTGLGLTFCKLAVAAQGGKIGVKSQLGEGSTFWFTISGHQGTPERSRKHRRRRQTEA